MRNNALLVEDKLNKFTLVVIAMVVYFVTGTVENMMKVVD